MKFKVGDKVHIHEVNIGPTETKMVNRIGTIDSYDERAGGEYPPYFVECNSGNFYVYEHQMEPV